jgi:hypothetical protein
MNKRIIGSAMIMVLTVSQVLFSFPFNLPEVQEAHAATRLGLHVTQEELNIWRSRRTNNVNGIGGDSYQTIYQNQILNRADTFKNQSHPGGEGWWAGYTGPGCVPLNDQSIRPQSGFNERDAGAWLQTAAFHFMLTGDTSYANPVRTELLCIIAQPGLAWSNGSKWYTGDGQLSGGNVLEIVPWLERLVIAYDYLQIGATAWNYTTLTAQNRQAIEQWFLDAATMWDTVQGNMSDNVGYGGIYNTPQDLSCSCSYCRGCCA